ncbi:hypothetical protein D9M71_840760 [compost metagenome]
MPSRINKNVSQRNSASQKRVAINAQSAATIYSEIGTPRIQLCVVLWFSDGASIHHQTMNAASTSSVIARGPAQ